MTYAAKVRIVNYALPVLIIAAFASYGLRNTRNLFAQTPAAADIYLHLPQTNYTLGQDVVVTLLNDTGKNVYVANHCPGEPFDVYRRGHNAWVAIHASTSVAKCAGEPADYEIPAHSSVGVDYKSWPTLFDRPGTYRIQADIESYQQGPSVQFTVSE